MIESFCGAFSVCAVRPMCVRNTQYHVIHRQLLIIIRIIIVVVINVHMRCFDHVSTNVRDLLNRWSRSSGWTHLWWDQEGSVAAVRRQICWRCVRLGVCRGHADACQNNACVLLITVYDNTICELVNNRIATDITSSLRNATVTYSCGGRRKRLLIKCFARFLSPATSRVALGGEWIPRT